MITLEIIYSFHYCNPDMQLERLGQQGANANS
jgi:hypothetical protein